MAAALEGRNLGHVAIIGGCGFLGHHIVNQLLDKHPQTRVSVLDLRTDRNRRDKVSYHDCDITNAEAINALFASEKFDVVIHTASPIVVGNTNWGLFKRVNVDGTKVLLKAAEENGVRSFVYTSSASVIMGKFPELINADERWPMIIGDEQPEYYTTTKGQAEQSVIAANRSGRANFLTCAIRPAGIFGEGDAQVVPRMVEASRKGQSRFQVGDNDNLFDFTYVGNVAHAHILAAIALAETGKLSVAPLDHEKVDGEAFFVTNDQPVYFWDFCRRLWLEDGDTLGTDPAKIWALSASFALNLAVVLEWVFGLFGKKPNLTAPSVRQSTLTRYYNINKARSRLGYSPIFSLEEGIRRAGADVKDRTDLGIRKAISPAEKKAQ